GLGASVAVVERAEDLDDGLAWGLRYSPPPLALLLVRSRGEPAFGPLGEVLLAEPVIVGDGIDGDADESQQERADESRAVLAADAVDEHGASIRLGDRAKGGAELGEALLEELEIRGARAPDRIDYRSGQRVDAGPEF